jgi:xylulokinase
MSEKLYIGLDIGTSGCKASVVGKDGTVVRYAHREYSTTSPRPGYIELDARVVLDAAREVLSKVAGPDVCAIAIASIGEAVVLLGDDDRVLAGSIYYSDIRGIEEVDDIKEAMSPEDILLATGMPVGPMFSANKLLWIKKNEPELYKAARCKMLFGDFISYMLTGEKVVDYSLASRTMLFDIKKRDWAHEVADTIGLDTDGFSKPVQSGTVIGKVRGAVARDLGLPEGTLVVAGGHDQTVAALGSGAVRPGESFDGMGSSECLTVVLGEGEVNPLMTRYGFCCEPHVIPDTFVTLAFNASAGAAIKWYRDIFEYQRLSKEIEAGENAYAILDSEIADEPTDILFLPYVSGSGTPWFDSQTGGAFIGLRQGQRKEDLYKAVLEGICYEIKYNETLLEKCGLSLHSIIAAGGGAQAARLMQIKADIMNRRIDVLENWEIGTVGLALICAGAMGDIDDIGAAAGSIARIARSYEPDASNAAHYAQKLKEYRSIYTSIKSLSAMPSSSRGAGIMRAEKQGV